MQAFRILRSPIFVLEQSDIDTDQIIPARFLTTTVREGLGQHLFADWRYGSDGRLLVNAPLNSDAARAAQVLVAGHNFGCGSSREHAPWALLDFGFRAVISTEIADIFKSNALKNGLLPVVVQKSVHEYLLEHSGAEIEIDLGTATLSLPDGRRLGFPIDPFSRYCLLEGIDQLDYLLNNEAAIAEYEKAMR